MLNEPDEPITATLLKTQLTLAVKQFLGTEGASSRVDVLKYNSKTKRFVLRCCSDNYVRLRAALTVANSFKGEPCNYNIHKVSTNLLTLTVNSRTFEH